MMSALFFPHGATTELPAETAFLNFGTQTAGFVGTPCEAFAPVQITVLVIVTCRALSSTN